MQGGAAVVKAPLNSLAKICSRGAGKVVTVPEIFPRARDFFMVSGPDPAENCAGANAAPCEILMHK